MDPHTSDRHCANNNDCPAPIPVIPVDLANEVKGMHRLLELIDEPESNGHGEKTSVMGETASYTHPTRIG